MSNELNDYKEDAVNDGEEIEQEVVPIEIKSQEIITDINKQVIAIPKKKKHISWQLYRK